MRAWTLIALTLFVFGCGGGGGGGGAGGTTTNLTFAGELAAFPDYAYDSGWLPEGSPVQVKMLFSVEGKLNAVAEAIVGGSTTDPLMSGVADSGKYTLAVNLIFQVLVKIDLTGVSYEGPVDENADITFQINDEAVFTPFMLTEKVSLAADVPDTQLITLPLAGSIPGVDGNVIINISGIVNSDFTPTCAAVSARQAEYLAQTFTSADLILKPSIQVKVPFVYDETIEVGDIPVSIPAVMLPMDLGTHEVIPGGGAVDGGGSLATPGECGEQRQPGDVTGGSDVTVEDAGGGDDVTGGDDNVSPGCADCAGCCQAGECLPGNTITACGVGGEACAGCEAGFECLDGVCADTSVGDCATECAGCCANNACLPGTEKYACGAGGGACIECGGGLDCAGGACVQGTAPCAEDCNGCCNGENCLPGNQDSACGFAGGACLSCGGNETCYDGVCQDKPYMCFLECSGCCLANQCYDGTEDSACGMNGVSCTSCAGNEACMGQVCVDQSSNCWETCDGCCDAGECMPGTDQYFCGSYGAECSTCDANFLCVAGECEVDPSSYWDIVALDGEVFYTPEDGTWDDWDGLPDLYAEFSMYYDENSGYGVVEETSVVDDVNHAYWDETVIYNVFAQDLLDEGLSVELWDSDVAFDDSIGSCGFLIGSDAFNGEPQSSCGVFGQFEVFFKLVPAP